MTHASADDQETPDASAESAPTESPAVDSKERRQHDRYRLARTVEVTEFHKNGNISWTGQTVDLSCGGIGILCRKMLHDGTVVGLRLPAVNGTMKVIVAVVRNCRYDAGVGYMIGCEFSEKPPTPQVAVWIAEQAKAAKRAS